MEMVRYHKQTEVGLQIKHSGGRSYSILGYREKEVGYRITKEKTIKSHFNGFQGRKIILTLTVVEKTKIKTFKQWQFDHMLYVIFL
jgi:hypothetical protein